MEYECQLVKALENQLHLSITVFFTYYKPTDVCVYLYMTGNWQLNHISFFFAKYDLRCILQMHTIDIWSNPLQSRLNSSQPRVYFCETYIIEFGLSSDFICDINKAAVNFTDIINCNNLPRRRLLRKRLAERLLSVSDLKFIRRSRTDIGKRSN